MKQSRRYFVQLLFRWFLFLFFFHSFLFFCSTPWKWHNNFHFHCAVKWIFLDLFYYFVFENYYVCCYYSEEEKKYVCFSSRRNDFLMTVRFFFFFFLKMTFNGRQFGLAIWTPLILLPHTIYNHRTRAMETYIRVVWSRIEQWYCSV
jgi:hypothetical protein